MTGPVPVSPVRSRWSHLCNFKSSAYGAGDCRFDPGRGYLKVPYPTFLTMGTQIPVIDEKPLAACGSGKFHLDVMGDHLCTCTTHSGAKKAHDWVVEELADLFRTTHTTKTQHVTKSRGRHCGDVELTVYLTNTVGPVSLVLDLHIDHDRFGSSSDPSLTGHLHP